MALPSNKVSSLATMLPIHDTDFFFSLVVFEVENVLFQVPKEGFVREPNFFAEMFTLPPKDGSDAEGSSEKNPISVTGVSAKEFRALLKILYPNPGAGNFKNEPMSVTRPTIFNPPQPRLLNLVYMPGLCAEDLKLALKAASFYDFKRIRDIIIYHLAETYMDIMEQIKVAIDPVFGIKEWIKPGIMWLAEREKVLTFDDEQFLGPEVMHVVRKLRDFHSCVENPRSPRNENRMRRIGRPAPKSASELFDRIVKEYKWDWI